MSRDFENALFLAISSLRPLNSWMEKAHCHEILEISTAMENFIEHEYKFKAQWREIWEISYFRQSILFGLLNWDLFPICYTVINKIRYFLQRCRHDGGLISLIVLISYCIASKNTSCVNEVRRYLHDKGIESQEQKVLKCKWLNKKQACKNI